MRIISGKFKSRKFYPPADKWPTRPTTDFAKEGLFNILNNTFDFEELSVLDLFCGTGSHTYEFLSRGCTDITSVDKFPSCIRFVKETLKTLESSQYVNLIKGDVFKFVDKNPSSYDYIFAGPPYGMANLDALPNVIFANELLKEEGWFVLEHNPNHDFKNHPKYLLERNYGKTIFSIFSNEANSV